MMPRSLVAILWLLLGCHVPLGPDPAGDSARAPGINAPASENQGSAKQTAWRKPSNRGPILIGVVTDPQGTPLPRIQVTPHAGMATRFPESPVETDDKGRYRLVPLGGQSLPGGPGQSNYRWIGVCVGSLNASGNPAELLPWKDVRVLDEPGIVVQMDFIYDRELK
ncbi:MAG: carboxypeptidase-like regulatory domain-containing protein [Planctomycetota bacterium]|nr:carboxypeptidase-like regulatory domain-containing protein [Planctomycetota bacterium]